MRPKVAYADTFARTSDAIVRQRHEAEAQLRERAARVEGHFGLPPGCVVLREGDPATELMKAAEEVNADGIVVGASTERIGSVAGHLVRHAPVPVTVVP